MILQANVYDVLAAGRRTFQVGKRSRLLIVQPVGIDKAHRRISFGVNLPRGCKTDALRARVAAMCSDLLSVGLQLAEGNRATISFWGPEINDKLDRIAHGQLAFTPQIDDLVAIRAEAQYRIDLAEMLKAYRRQVVELLNGRP